MFEFATAGRILFGRGAVDRAGGIVAALGRDALVVTGRDPRRAQLLLDRLSVAGVRAVTFAVAVEPTVDLVRAGVAAAARAGAAVVVGIGGGSVMDAAKAIAALAANQGAPEDYLEVVGRGRPLERPPLPVVAIPTTAGTGSEVTRNAVLTVSERQVKVSLRSPLMLPRAAIVDPDLTLDVPPAVTASTGLDALTQLIEPLVSSRANPMTDALVREAIPRVARSLLRAFEQGSDVTAREEMSLAALIGGLALANAGLGAAHGFAAPIGGAFPAPHGAICAALLPNVIDVNVRAMRDREPGNPARSRYDEVGRLLTGDPTAGARDAVDWVRATCTALGVAPLGSHGVTDADVPALVERAAVSSSMQANPIRLTTGELEEILRRSL